MAEEVINKVTNTLKNIDSYELMKNDKNEVMVLLYAGDTPPSRASFYLNEKAKYIELSRNSESIAIIENLQDESIKQLKELKKLYVCEIKYDEKTNTNEEEAEIVFAYSAKQSPTERRTIQDKAKEQREKITEEKNKKTTSPEQQ